MQKNKTIHGKAALITLLAMLTAVSVVIGILCKNHSDDIVISLGITSVRAFGVYSRIFSLYSKLLEKIACRQG